MALEDIDRLDIALKSPDGRVNGTDLLLFDHGNTEDSAVRYTLLTRKLGTHVAYVMSDDFRSANPLSKPTDVIIRVLCKAPPNSAMTTVQAVYPKGDRVNRIPVVFEDLNEFVANIEQKDSDI